LVSVLNFGLSHLLRRVFAALKQSNADIVEGLSGDRVIFVGQCEELMNVGSAEVKEKAFYMMSALALAIPPRNAPAGSEDVVNRLKFQLNDQQYTHCFNHVSSYITALNTLSDTDEEEKETLEKSKKRPCYCDFNSTRLRFL
jgi:hypothetical protein